MRESDSGNTLAQTLTTIAGLLAAFAACVYVIGGLVLAARLGLRQLPSTAVISQLPREFLVSSGLLIIGLPMLLGGLTYVLLPSKYRSSGRKTRTRCLCLAMVVIVTLIASLLLISKEPFTAKACLEGGGSVSGFFIGETSDRTYLGEQGATPRRIISVPTARVERLLIGGDAAGARCEPREG
jgi:hypothetical protein